MIAFRNRKKERLLEHLYQILSTSEDELQDKAYSEYLELNKPFDRTRFGTWKKDTDFDLKWLQHEMDKYGKSRKGIPNFSISFTFEF